MNQKIATITKQFKSTKVPQLRSGDVIKVMQKVVEGGKERLQPFEGTIISIKHGRQIEGMMTVRAKYGKHYVERTFPLHSPKLASIEVLRHSKARRAKLYYLRQRTGKKAAMRRIDLTDEEMKANEELAKTEEVVEETPAETAADDATATEETPAATEAPVEETPEPKEEAKEEAPAEEPATQENTEEKPADEADKKDEK